MKKFLQTLICSTAFAVFTSSAFATDYSIPMELKDINVRSGTPNCRPSDSFVSGISYKTRSDGKASLKFAGSEERFWGLRSKNGMFRARFKKDDSGYKIRFKARNKNVIKFIITERKAKDQHECGFKYSNEKLA